MTTSMPPSSLKRCCASARQPTRRAGPRLAAVAAALAAFKPKDEIEGMLAAQATALHSTSMECLRRAMLPNQPPDIASRLRKDGTNWRRHDRHVGGPRQASEARGRWLSGLSGWWCRTAGKAFSARSRLWWRPWQGGGVAVSDPEPTPMKARAVRPRPEPPASLADAERALSP